MSQSRLDCIAMNVNRLEDAISFYTRALGFTAGAVRPDPVTATLLGARNVRAITLHRGQQSIELTECDPPGAAYPADSHSNDPWFQHCALVTDDMAASFARLDARAFTAISRDGPQALPGGIVAFKFRDPDGHPLELIQFPRPTPATAGGIDHSAIAVSDPARSIAFYAAEMGLTVQARQQNTGPAQDRLDDLDGACVDVIALAPPQPSPHVELLGYRSPAGRAARLSGLCDIASSRLVFAGCASAGLLRDPDGHVVRMHCPLF